MRIEKKKLLIGAAVAAAVGLLAFLGGVLYPTQLEIRKIRGSLERSEQALQAKARELQTLQAREQRAAAEIAQNAWAQQLLKTLPESFYASVPSTISRAFAAREIAPPKVRLVMLLPFTGIPGHALAKWEIQASGVRALRLGETLSDLENGFPMGELAALSLAPERTGGMSATLVFHTIVKP